MSDPDPELESLMAKRMAEMRSRAARGAEEKEEAPSKSPREIVVGRLGYRGLEVLRNAEAQRPRETAVLVAKLAEIIESGELRDPIGGGDLLALFGSLGIRIRMETRISVESDGKLVSLSDKLSSARPREEDG